jgi:4-amino-4-deoxy-L-arabinose transferase-like glycosyltransferase
LIVGSALNDDSLLGLLAALYFLMLVQVIKNPTRWFPVIGLGIMLGVTATVKYSLVLMPLEIIGVLGFFAVREKLAWRWFLSRLAVVGLLTILCSGWWFGWNIWFFNTVAKDGLIAGTVRALFMGGYNATLNSIGGVLSSGQVTEAELPPSHQTDLWSNWFNTTFLSFWGFNIDGQFPLFPWAYLIVGVTLVLAGVGLWQLWRRPSPARSWLLLAGLHVMLLCLIPLLRFATSGRVGQTAQGRHILIPAATAIVALIAWGLATAVPRRWHGVVFAVIIAGMIGWTGVHLYQLT